MIIMAIPFSGKTTAAQEHPELFVDSDEVVKRVAGSTVANQAIIDMIASSATLSNKLCNIINGADQEGKVVLCNFYPGVFRLRCDLGVAYKPSEYVEHIVETCAANPTGRVSLLADFDEPTLRAWAKTYESRKNTVFLKKGEYITLEGLRLACKQYELDIVI